MAFNFKNAFSNNSDKIDMKKFMTDNEYYGSEQFYRDKTGDKLPEYIYPLLEAQARQEYTEEEMNKTMNILKEQYLNCFNTIMKDFEDRKNENIDAENPGSPATSPEIK